MRNVVVLVGMFVDFGFEVGVEHRLTVVEVIGFRKLIS